MEALFVNVSYIFVEGVAKYAHLCPPFYGPVHAHVRVQVLYFAYNLKEFSHFQVDISCMKGVPSNNIVMKTKLCLIVEEQDY